MMEGGGVGLGLQVRGRETLSVGGKNVADKGALATWEETMGGVGVKWIIPVYAELIDFICGEFISPNGLGRSSEP